VAANPPSRGNVSRIPNDGGSAAPSDLGEVSVLTQNAPAAFGLAAFVGSAGLLSMSSVANIVRAIVTAKLIALTLGPSLTGVLAQILNFNALLFQIVPLGLTTGVAKMVAESKGHRSRLGAVVGTSSALALASAIACTALLVPFADQISVLLTGSAGYGLPVIFVLASLPLNNLAGVLGYVLQGLSDVGRLTAANLGTVVVSLAVLIPATIEFHLIGAAAAVAIASLVQATFFVAAILWVYHHKSWPLSDIHFSRATAAVLLRYGGVLVVSGIGAWGSLLVVRTIGIHDLGEFQNGIYQVVNGFSAQYMAVFITWMAAYVFPRVVSESEHGRLQTLLNSTLRANLLIMVPGLVLTIALRELLIRIFYSSAFIGAAPLLPIQVLGDFARVLGWSFGICLFAHGRTRAFLAVMLSQDVLWIGITAATLHSLGTAAIAMGYSLSSMAWPLLMYPMVRHWFGVRIDAEGALLSIVGVMALLGAILFAGVPGALLAGAVPLVIYLARLRRRRRLPSHT
jgi:O-antigen/teichoic acid export membrane protein